MFKWLKQKHVKPIDLDLPSTDDNHLTSWTIYNTKGAPKHGLLFYPGYTFHYIGTLVQNRLNSELVVITVYLDVYVVTSFQLPAALILSLTQPITQQLQQSTTFVDGLFTAVSNDTVLSCDPIWVILRQSTELAISICYLLVTAGTFKYQLNK